MAQNIVLYDTTLRDGAQTEGISLSVNDKLLIAGKLAELALPYIEGGWPGSSPKELEFFRKARRLALGRSQVVAFGSTRRAHVPVGKDPQIKGLLSAQTRGITIFGKSWDLHVRDALRVTLDENLRMIGDSVFFLTRRGRKVMYDAEHFFDGWRENPDYAMKTLQVAQDSGAEVVILCDTNGGALPHQIAQIVEAVRRRLSVPLGIHCHNDTDVAVANSVAAVQAGVTQVQGTVNGYGERCGNANLCSLLAILQLRMGYRCLPPDRLKALRQVSHYVAEVCNMRPEDHQPFVGTSAFAHKGGVHINAVVKNPKTYEHIDPAAVGNRRRLLVSELGGRSTILARAKALGLKAAGDAAEAKRFMETVQEMEAQGYHFEAAEESFELLMQRAYQRFKQFFALEGFRVEVTKDAQGRVRSEATLKVRVGSVSEHTAAEGDGPVHALDRALRKALLGFYPVLNSMHLVDFKVRDLESQAGTAARVRVLIQSQDEKESWWTIGVHENIIEASWRALVDSVEYKLLKERKARQKSRKSVASC